MYQGTIMFVRWRLLGFSGAPGIALLLLALTVGGAAGVGAYTFVYARGASYVTNDPAACVKCHVMRPQFDGWIKYSHHAVAETNDGA